MTTPMPRIEPEQPQRPEPPRDRWWWQPYLREHPVRFVACCLLVIAGGIGWGAPVGEYVLGPVLHPDRPAAAPSSPSATPSERTTSPKPRRTHRERPQPTYSPPPTFRTTPSPTRTHRPSPSPTKTSRRPILCPPICPSESSEPSPSPRPTPTPSTQPSSDPPSAPTKDPMSLVSWRFAWA
jgi:hypothetical protein